MSKHTSKKIAVYADWEAQSMPTLVGLLTAVPSRGKEIFSFSYDPQWLKSASHNLDPRLQLFQGYQYAPRQQANFSVFLDSSPDRWGRFLMRRREALLAKQEKRAERQLLESDYLLGVYDQQRIGGLRFCLDAQGPFLNDNKKLASPPWTSLRELEQACLMVEKSRTDDNANTAKWLNMLIAPGGSLGGARPKAGVVGKKNQLWIAKFPSQYDDIDIGAWEMLANRLAIKAGVTVAEAQLLKFTGPHHTFLTKRFDRTSSNRRLHFASAMTLLQRTDGDDANTGASYLELAELIIQQGAHPGLDLEELWRRIVFNICVSNVDDHLRNHGFILTPEGWRLSPAYDVNPVAFGDGLKINISATDNSQDLHLASKVAKYFRLKPKQAHQIIKDVVTAVQGWQKEAKKLHIPLAEQERMASAFRCAKEL